MEGIAIPVITVNQTGDVCAISPSVSPFFKRNSKQKPTSINDLLPNCMAAFGGKLKAKDPLEATLPLVCDTGRKRWIKASAHPLNDGNGHIQILFEDVTQTKTQYDLALQAKTIAKVGSWTVDLTTNTLVWSSMTKSIHEVSEDYVPNLEKGINFYKEGASRERIIAAVSDCIATGKSFDVELIIITAKGNEKWVRSIGHAEQVNGKTIAFSGVFQDIDEAKRERLKYEALSERLKIGIDSANVGVWDFDLINNELFWDDKMYQLYGVDKEDFDAVYNAWERTIHPHDKERAAKEVTMAINGEKDFNTEFRILKKDGSMAVIHAEAKVFRDENGKPYRLIGANTDVTKIKQTDNRLRRLLNVTEKQNQRLLQFTNIVSHNLRSNSSNISMLAGMLDTDLSAGQQTEFIDMIKTSAERLDETIVQLNEIVKIQATDTSEMAPVGIKTTVEKVLQSVNALLLKADAKVNLDVDENLTVLGIKPYIQSVFMNLVTNSIKYKRPDVPVEISISAKVAKGKTMVMFKDNGLGIDLKKHGSKLFGMYKTFHNNKDAKGVGLFITKNHMEAMEGSIALESAVNEGTLFHLQFINQAN